MDISSVLRRERKTIDEVISGLQPGEYGVLTSPGGVGKSFLMLRAAIEMALGHKMMGGVFGPVRPGGQVVAYLSLEDAPETRVHNRAISIVEEMQITEAHPLAAQLARNLIVCNATHLIGGTSDSIPFDPEHPPRLIIIDTFRSFAPGLEENSAKEVAELIYQIRKAAKILGAAVLIVHKGAMGAHSNDKSTAGQERGSSLLRDNARAAWTVWPPTPNEIKNLKLSVAQAAQHVILKASKSNHSAGDGLQWFHKNCQGVPVPVAPPGRLPVPTGDILELRNPDLSEGTPSRGTRAGRN